MSSSFFLLPHRRVFAAFAIYSFILGQLFTRLPAVKAEMGIGEGALGLALVGAPVGTMISLTLGAPVIERLGNRLALLIALPVMALIYAIAIHATGPLGLFLMLIPAGVMIGAIEIVVNIEADRTEAAMGRRIMNRSHAFWSIGFFGAGLFGALMAQLGVSPQWQLGLVLPITLVAVWYFLRDFEPAAKRGTDNTDKAPLVARPSLGILALVGVSLSAMLLEGGSFDWSAVYMSEEFDTLAIMGGLAVAVTAGSQALVRFFADTYVERFNPVRIARFMQGAMALGVLFVFLAPTPLVGLLGFALIGGGTGVMFPLAMSAAAQRTDRPSAINVAALAQFSFIAFLLGPPLLGFVAEYAGLRWTFGVILPLVVLSFLLSGKLESDQERPAKSA